MDERRNDEHKLTMVGRNKMTVTGVEDVDSFDDDKIVAYTTEGVMTVKGADFRINRLSVEDGGLEIEGEIDSIEYADGHKSDKGGFFSKIFR
ncbi:MAG: sporulation protein YabP [Clostridia bacterium]|nr:sporulation protein YabP [Clostridia bacterium]